jgi:hypothetical protein
MMSGTKQSATGLGLPGFRTFIFSLSCAVESEAGSGGWEVSSLPLRLVPDCLTGNDER